MDITRVIARNLATLMADDPNRDTLVKVSKAAGVGFGTVRRAKNGDGNLTVQNLELIAQAFRRSARDLLIDPDARYATAPTATILQVAESPADELTLIAGYRDGSQEVREIMLDLARKASKKNCGISTERND